jgi:hypothetical protein
MKKAIKKLFGREETIAWEDPKLNTPVPMFRSRNMRVSDLEEATHLSDDDYLLLSDTSEKKSVKVKLGTLKEYIRWN